MEVSGLGSLIIWVLVNGLGMLFRYTVVQEVLQHSFSLLSLLVLGIFLMSMLLKIIELVMQVLGQYILII
jgi:hypothetical protein